LDAAGFSRLKVKIKIGRINACENIGVTATPMAESSR
jgi:hypothetical protein